MEEVVEQGERAQVRGVEELLELAMRRAREEIPKKAGSRSRFEVKVLVGEDAGKVDEAALVRELRLRLGRDGPAVRFSVRVQRGGSASSVEVAERIEVVQLTRRDLDVLGFLAVARRLTADQLRALSFPGRHFTIPYRRLAMLAAARLGGGGYVRQDAFFGGRGERAKVVAWSVTNDGYAAVSAGLPYLRAYSTAPPAAATLEHDLWLADLFVGLATARGSPVSPGDLPFRWLCDTDRPLAFRTLNDDADLKTNLLRPDAIVELPLARRRVFIEAERGTHTISPTSTTNTGGTTVKARRYARFVAAPTDGEGKVTAYRATFPDGYRPELLFLVHSDWRRLHVVEALAADRARDANPPDLARHVLTMDQAREMLVGALPVGWAPTQKKPAATPAEGVPGLGETRVRVLVRAGDARLLRDGFNVLLDELRARGGTKDLGSEPKSIVRRTRDLIVWLVSRAGAGRSSWAGAERRRASAAGEKG